MRITIVAMLALLTGCASQYISTEKLTNIALTDQQQKIIQDAVTKQLLDPESARFYDVQATAEANGRTWVCGQVNSKNRFGGYVGKQEFVGHFINEPAPHFQLMSISGFARQQCIGVGIYFS